jgi:hypothetical protein
VHGSAILRGNKTLSQLLSACNSFQICDGCETCPRDKTWRLSLPAVCSQPSLLIKVYPRTEREDPEVEKMDCSTLCLTSALDVSEWSAPSSGPLPPGKTRYPLCSGLGGPQGRSARVWKISPPSGFDLWTVQPVPSRYTVCGIPANQQGHCRM